MNSPSARRFIARLLIAAMLAVPQAQASGIGTEEAVRSNRERILTFVKRPDVRAQLEARGVKPVDAAARIEALTDAEVAKLASDIEVAAAGGNIGKVVAGLVVVLAFVVVAAVVVVGTAATLAYSGVKKLVQLASRD